MILAILQARLSSSRFPKKVLQPILGIPMILHQIKRIKQSKLIDKIILATSAEPSDADLVKTCKDNNILIYTGNLNNVLERFYQIYKTEKPSYIVRLTGDCPVTDPQVIDQVIAFHKDHAYEYTSNTAPDTFPDGLDVEIINALSFEKIITAKTSIEEKEHVTLYIHNNPKKFKIGNYQSPIDYSKHRWTVDYKEDFQFITEIYQHLFKKNPSFNMQDILSLLKKKPELIKINQHILRNESLVKK